MATELTVRRYRPTDAEAVWAVHEAALRASPLPFVEDAAADEDLHAIEASYLAAGGEFLVGEIGGCGEGDDSRGPDAASEIVAIGGYRPADGHRSVAGHGPADDPESVDGHGSVDDRGPADGDEPADDRTAELRRMRVRPEHQRQGYGRRLLEALEERARRAGFDALELETVERLRAALALYRDAGYDVADRDEHPETGDELLTLEKRL